jgi:hypothetical protein
MPKPGSWNQRVNSIFVHDKMMRYVRFLSNIAGKLLSYKQTKVVPKMAAIADIISPNAPNPN